METDLILLRTLEDVAAEAEARLPGYLRRQPLQLVASDPWAARCLALAEAVDLPLRRVSDDGCNTADHYLHHRLAHALGRPAEAAAAPGPTSAAAAIDREGARHHWRQLVAARHAQHEAARTLGQRLSERDVPSIPGLRYYALGAGGPPLVVLNALGQTLTAWLPLAERLARRHQVLLCPPRTTDLDGHPVRFSDHCEDLRAVLAHEGISACHLIGWCTGAKLAARYARQHPGAVRSLAFLAGSFKHPGRSAALDTRYERNLEAMLRAVVQQPELAHRLRVVLAQAASGSHELDRLDGKGLALRALTGVPAALERDARHPFRDAAALVTYAHQHLDFWSHDELAAPPLRVPALGLIGEHDPIIGAPALRLALEAFTVSGFEVIPGATHYSFYERPLHVAGALEQWAETWNEASSEASSDASNESSNDAGNDASPVDPPARGPLTDELAPELSATG